MTTTERWRRRGRWISGTDRMIAGGRYIVMATDLNVPSPALIRDALEVVLAAGPHTRVGLAPTAHRLWRYSRSTPVPVNEIPADVADADIGTVLEYIRRRPGERHWVEACVSHRHIAMDVDHGLGDGEFVTSLIASVLALAEGRTPRWVTERDTRLPLLKAMTRTFGAKPRLVGEALKTAGSLKKSSDVTKANSQSTEAERPLRHWSPSYAAMVVTVDPDAQAAVERWRKANVPACTVSLTWMFIGRRALAAAGFDIADNVMLAFNCRRYLPAGARANGNFASGLEVMVNDESSMSEVGAEVRRITSSAWPLAFMGVVSTVGQMRRSSAAARPVSQVRVDAPVQLMYTDLGRLPLFDDSLRIPGRQPCFNGLLDPTSPESLTLFGNSAYGTRSMGASFHDNVIDRQMVADALHRVRDEPLKLLTGE